MSQIYRKHRINALIHTGQLMMAILAVSIAAHPTGLEASTIQEKERVAVKFLGWPAKSKGVVVEQTFWPHHTIFSIVHPSSGRLFMVAVVAVNEQGGAALLNRDPVNLKEKAHALENFNRIAQAEAVQITPENVEAYGRFFLSVYLPAAGVYLPDQQAAETVVKTPWHSEAASRLEETYQRKRGPRVTFTFAPRLPNQQHFDPALYGTAFTWEFWWGGVKRYEMTIHPNGTVLFREELFGKQRG